MVDTMRANVISKDQKSNDRNDMEKFSASVTCARHKSAPTHAMCNDREGNFLTAR